MIIKMFGQDDIFREQIPGKRAGPFGNVPKGPA